MSAAPRPPVSDWAEDFDHTDPEWVSDPYPIWDELRETCPVAHTERYGGTWLPVRHEDVAAIAYDTEHFTSRSVIDPSSERANALMKALRITLAMVANRLVCGFLRVPLNGMRAATWLPAGSMRS